MDQFLSRLLDKYGLLRIFIAVLSGFFVLWALAHITAAPGGNVSVLWGLVQYTKNKPDTDNTTSTKQQQAFDQKQKMGESSPAVLPASLENIAVVQGITEKNVGPILQSLRSQRQLRALETLESGRTVAETPRGTYFFVSIFYMTVSEGNMAATLIKKKVDRFGGSDAYFEIHYPQNGPLLLVGFTSESDAARLASPSHGVQRVSLSALPWEKMPSLVLVPADKIISANDRYVDLSKDHRIQILDAEIK